MFSKKYATQDSFDISALGYTFIKLKAKTDAIRYEGSLNEMLKPSIVGCEKDDLWDKQILLASEKTILFLDKALKRLCSVDSQIKYSERNIELMAYVISTVARDFEPDGSARKRAGSFFTPSHPNPVERVDVFFKNLDRYFYLATIRQWGGNAFE